MTIAARRPSAGRHAAVFYDLLSPSERYIHVTRDQAFFALLRRHGVESLAGIRILELGCGVGSLLRTLVAHGAETERLHGVDIDGGRLASAGQGAGVAAADIGALPYSDATFDLALAFTVLSSVLGPETRRRGALEALRVLRPGGLLVIYDFWVNPTNRSVRPVGAAELRALFAPLRIEIERITLAPPIVRALSGRQAICRRLERLPFLRTHLLAAVRKDRD